jgi:hypothetical protein
MNAPAGTAAPARPGTVPRAVARLLLVAAIVRFWLMPLPAGFWLDETGTVWAVQDGLAPMLARIRDWPTVTPLYGVIACIAHAIGGPREYVMRLPSVAAMGMAVLCLYKLARRLLDEDCARAAAVVFLCSSPVITAAPDARPYAFLLLAVCASTYALVLWLDTGRARWAAAYVVAAAAMPHLHYTAAAIFCAQAAYLLLRMREGCRVPARQWIAAGAGLGLLLAPLIPDLQRIFLGRGGYSFADPPTWIGLVQLLTPPVLVFSLLAAVPLAGVYCRGLRMDAVRLDRPTVAFIAACVAIVLLFFAASHAGPTRIFVPRYLIGSQVGIALLAGWLVGRLRPLPAQSIACSAILLGSLVAFGSLDKLWPARAGEDWRAVIRTVREASAEAGAPVVMQSPFVEAFPERYDFTRPLPAFLYAPLAVYPLEGEIVRIPFGLNRSSQSFLETGVLPMLRGRDRFVLLNRASPHAGWFQSRLPEFRARLVRESGPIQVHLFERMAARR